VNPCRAYANGVDTTNTNSCVTGVPTGPCFADSDCMPGESLQCCPSPLGILTCVQTTGTCPLTP